MRGHYAVFDRRTRLTGEFGVMFLMTNARLKGVPRQKLVKTQQNSTRNKYNHRLRRRCISPTISLFRDQSQALFTLGYDRATNQ